jgi:hypothetical protein
MSLRTLIIKQASSFSAGRINQWKKSAVKDQHATLKELIQKAEKTIFGQDHHFGKIRSYTNFKERVPVRDYEALRPYIDRVTQGEKDILWPGKPAYFAKTSGTTSGVKYIPISRESMPNHIHTAQRHVQLLSSEGSRKCF